MRESDVALSAFLGVDAEEGLVGVYDVVWIVIETMEPTVGEESTQFDAIEQGGRAEDAFPIVEFP